MEKVCVFSTAGNNNDNADNIIFTIKYTKLYAPVVTLSARDKPKLSKLLSNRLEKSSCWNKYRTKSENKNTINEYKCFP